MARSRSLTSALARLLAASSLPIYVLNDQRQIVYANPAFFAWTGADPERLIGARCDYHSSPEVGPVGEIAAKLCPPAEVFGGQHVTAAVACRRPSGEFSHRRAEFLPLGPDALDLAGVIAVVDGTDLPRSEGPAGQQASPTPADLHRRLLMLREQIVPRYGIDRLVGESLMIRRIRRQVRVAHQSRARVVVVGPPGSGREHVARTIHYGDDPQAAGRLVPVSCGLMDAELLQATIASVVRHPVGQRDMRRATLLLLEVDQLAETAQYELAASFRDPHTELHAVSTARRDLLQLAAAGTFREDLAAALSTLVIQLPPLGERPEDIPALAQVFLERFNAKGGRQLSGFSSEALDQLVQYPWPGNVDELAEMVESSCAGAEGPLVQAADLPQRIRLAAGAAAYPRQPEERIVLDDFLAEIEQELIRRAMRRAKGNKTKAAQLLGVTRARLHRRLEQMGFSAPDPKPGETD